MLRYIALSALLNLFFFALLSSILCRVSTFEPPLIKKKFIKPLKIFLNPPRETESSLKSLEGSFTIEGKSPRIRKKQQLSLLESLLPSVRKELKEEKIFKSSGKLGISKGKAKLSFKRRVVYVPPIKPLKVSLPPSPMVVRITVLPDGRVASVVILKGSGNAEVDREVVSFLKNLRFEPVKENRLDEITVRVSFTF